jgi:phospholipase B1
MGLSAALAQAGRFSCPSIPKVAEPKTIADLHPSHVSVVMAMGDSITAAFTARSGLNEDRDLSWSIGAGSADQLTLPWLLEQYSDKVEGQSTKAVLPRDIANLPSGDYHPMTDGMNVAESEGAAHRGSLDEQWGYLLQNFPKYDDFDNRWKVLTLWMFANDVLGMCDKDAEEYDEYKVWEAKLDETLTNVTQTLTKTYVNLAAMLDLSHIHRIQKSKIGCTLVHKVIKEGGCVDKDDVTDDEMQKLDENVHFMNKRLHKFAADYQAKMQAQGRNDMAFVVQGFTESIGPELDHTFLSSLDCFHPSASAHQDLAVGLWNSMLCVDDREGRCGIVFGPDMPVTCPTESSVFYTGADVIPGPPPSSASLLI